MTEVTTLTDRPEPAGAHRSRIRPYLIAAAALAVTGLPIGALWAQIAPPIHAVVALTRSGERVHAYLGPESDNFFTAPALMSGLVSVLAVVSAVWLWQWRVYRGPGMVIAQTAGLAAAVGVSAGTAALLVHLRYGTVDVDAAPVTPENRVYYVTEAPPVFYGHAYLQIVATVLLPTALAALVWALGAAASARDDLGSAG